MDVARPHVCPILVGRDDLLTLAERRIGEVVAGAGRFLILAGEAGIGKTRLLEAVEGMAVSVGMRVVRSGAYPSDLQVAGAILIDLSRAMTRSQALAAVGERLAARLEDGGADARDPAHRRRLLVLDVAEILATAAADHPTMLQFEDLHWCDDLTLEVLEALARRVPDVPLLVVGTYRSDELMPRTPMRAWRARLVGQRRIEEARLGRLSAEDTATMTTLLIRTGLPAPRDLVDVVQRRTDGIPLHVEEWLGLLAAAGYDPREDRLAPEDVHETSVPDTLEDAIVGRLAQRTEAAAAVARAGAVIGRSFDLDMLVAVTGVAAEALSEPLAELADHAILLPTPTPGTFGFRHALIGDAIYGRIPEPERRRLHARTADAAAGRPRIGTAAFLALHFERAGRADEAHRAAVAAATEAAAISSHAEARELYACAIRTMPDGLAATERGSLWEAFGQSAAAVDDNDAAAQALETARDAYVQGGDPLRAAVVVASIVAVRHLLGDGLDDRAARLRTALAELERARPGPPVDRVRARLLAALSAAYMLDRRLEESVLHGRAALDLASATSDQRTAVDAATTIGSCRVFAGDQGGWTQLEQALGVARDAGLEVDVARTYRMISSCASVLVEYERADHWLREGISYAEAMERWNDRHYMAAHLAHVLWARGRWPEADEAARHALADGRGGITTRVTALHVLGFVALGRDELTAAEEYLREARALGSRMRELQRLAPALWGLAEVALARGEPGAAMVLAEEGVAASAAVEDGAYRFPFLVTGTRALLAADDPGGARRWVDAESEAIRRRGIPGTLPAIDHADGLALLAEGATGKARTALEAARAGWSARQRSWEGTWATLDLARAALRSNRRRDAAALADDVRTAGRRLPAPALVREAEALRRATGRGTASAPWEPLTAREFEVARLVAEGLTNVEIAERMGVARKTASAHVEHILAKLGVARRAEIAAWTAARPVLHSRPHGDDREE